MFERFFKLKAVAPQSHPEGEQAVLLYLEGEDFDRMLHLSEKLTAIEEAKVRMFDGNEIGGDETVLFMYGPDAEALFRTIEPVLLQEESAHGARAVIRWGDVGSPQRELVICSKPNAVQ